MNKMKIEYLKLSDIKPYEKNPRKNEEAIPYVKNSIEQFGFRVPIILDSENTIVSGHTRYAAAKELGIDEVPCVRADELTPEQIKAFRIADNKTAERADWDEDLLGDELSELLGEFDMTDFGFGDFELTMLTEDFEPEPYDPEVTEKYSEHEEEYLLKKRVIITYSDEYADKVREMLGVEAIDKVVYDIAELV